MADLPVTPLANYGELLSSLPLADSTVATQSAQQNVARANVGNIQANTGMTQAQTQGVDIANQGAALSLGALKQAYANGIPGVQGLTSSSPSSSIGDTGVEADSITQHAIEQFAPIPTKPPPALQQQAYLLSLGGRPESGKLLLDNYAMQAAGATQQRALAASQSYQTAEAVASAPAGSAWETLNRANPQAAAALKQKYPNDSADQLDADVRSFAQHIGIAVHQYSGRDTEFQNGVLVDKKDGKPVLGSEQVLTGLDAKGKEAAFASANELVTVKNSDGSESQIPRWQQAGKPSAEAYVIGADRAARSSANGSTAAPTTSGNTAATASPPKATAAPAPPASVTTDPVLKSALADPDYKVKTPPVVSGRSATPAQLDQQKATVQARTDLLKDSSDGTQAASQSFQYLNAAKQIMDSKGAPVTGLFGPARNEISRVWGGVDATNYQEVAKYLGNAALANAKGIYGSRMSTSEVGLQLNELSPSVHMTDEAVNNLIDNNIKSAQYTIDSAKRSRAYLATGGDPQSFSQWNQQYYPREKVVAGAPARPGQQASGPVQTATGPNGQKLYLRNGQWASQ